MKRIRYKKYGDELICNDIPVSNGFASVTLTQPHGSYVGSILLTYPGTVSEERFDAPSMQMLKLKAKQKLIEHGAVFEEETRVRGPRVVREDIV